MCFTILLLRRIYNRIIHFSYFASDIIDGLEELHNLGYHCPDLKGDDIAVIKQSGSISAKIWKYSACDSGKNYFPNSSKFNCSF